ncbi:hypothetical protein [Tritonibacter mobilis]|uniref:hypothetical protein n=1 Tax=Tritonibacter mobilis TaxID=379347 RepID=UPI000E0CC858|nr:hypothetical protein [Tritonibacter mobilis]
MDKFQIKAIAKKVAKKVPQNLNGAEKADIYAILGMELGLSHLLLPEARPDALYDIQLPDVAPEFYEEREDRKEGVVAFITRAYAPWIGQGLAQHHIGRLDPKLYRALHNWLQYNPFPDDLDLPTKKQLNDRELEKLGLTEGETLPYPSYYRGLKDKLRLYNAARNRAKITDPNG